MQRSYFVWTENIKSLFNICCTNRLDVPTCAAAFRVDSLGLLCSATLDSVNVLRRTHSSRPATFFLSNT
jgi:hypothetical protein